MKTRFARYYRFIRDLERLKAYELVEQLFGEREVMAEAETWSIQFDDGQGTRTLSLLEQVRLTPFMIIPHLFVINDAIRDEQTRLLRAEEAIPKGLYTFLVVPSHQQRENKD